MEIEDLTQRCMEQRPDSNMTVATLSSTSPSTAGHVDSGIQLATEMDSWLSGTGPLSLESIGDANGFCG